MTKNPRLLGRRPEVDPRSAKYTVEQPLADLGVDKPRSKVWGTTKWFDQGWEGSCVGFAWAHAIVAQPIHRLDTDAVLARQIYLEAQKVDPWPGENYAGTSVLAGAKTVRTLGFISAYRWANTLDALVMALGYIGPAVLGINWYEKMWRTDAKGFIHPTGDVEGGHAIMCRSVNVKTKTFSLRNSWGRNWGRDGSCFVSYADMEQLLGDGGEACVPIA